MKGAGELKRFRGLPVLRSPPSILNSFEAFSRIRHKYCSTPFTFIVSVYPLMWSVCWCPIIRYIVWKWNQTIITYRNTLWSDVEGFRHIDIPPQNRCQIRYHVIYVTKKFHANPGGVILDWSCAVGLHAYRTTLSKVVCHSANYSWNNYRW